MALKKLVAQDAVLSPILKLIPKSATDEQIYFYIWVQDEAIAERIPVPKNRNEHCVEMVRNWIIADVESPTNYTTLHKLRPLAYKTIHFEELIKYATNRAKIFTPEAIKKIQEMLGFTTPKMLASLLTKLKDYPGYQQYALVIAYFLHIEGAFYNKRVFINFICDGPVPPKTSRSARTRWAQWGNILPRFTITNLDQKLAPLEKATSSHKLAYTPIHNTTQLTRSSFSINSKRVPTVISLGAKKREEAERKQREQKKREETECKQREETECKQREETECKQREETECKQHEEAECKQHEETERKQREEARAEQRRKASAMAKKQREEEIVAQRRREKEIVAQRRQEAEAVARKHREEQAIAKKQYEEIEKCKRREEELRKQRQAVAAATLQREECKRREEELQRQREEAVIARKQRERVKRSREKLVGKNYVEEDQPEKRKKPPNAGQQVCSSFSISYKRSKNFPTSLERKNTVLATSIPTLAQPPVTTIVSPITIQTDDDDDLFTIYPGPPIRLSDGTEEWVINSKPLPRSFSRVSRDWYDSHQGLAEKDRRLQAWLEDRLINWLPLASDSTHRKLQKAISNVARTC